MAGPLINIQWQRKLKLPMLHDWSIINIQWQRKQILSMLHGWSLNSIPWQRKLILPMLHGWSHNKYLMATETNIANVTWLAHY